MGKEPVRPTQHGLECQTTPKGKLETHRHLYPMETNESLVLY